MFSNSIKTLRTVGTIEAISYLLLLGLAMPLKYGADSPLAVQIIGPIHGALWVLYIVIAGWVGLQKKWGFINYVAAFVASILPFGPLVFDYWISRQEQENKVIEGKPSS